MKAAITVDLEDWFQLITLRSLYPVDQWTPELLRIQIPLRRLPSLPGGKKHAEAYPEDELAVP